MTLLEVKTEILRRAKEANACAHEYRRCLSAESEPELIAVICDNFTWCGINKVIDAQLLGYLSISARHEAGLFVSESAGARNKNTFLIGINATVGAYDNATVEAFDNATVEACGNATVHDYAGHNVTIAGRAVRFDHRNKRIELRKSDYKIEVLPGV